MSGLEPRKTIIVNPDFLKFPMRGGRTKKNRDNATPPKPIKIRTEKKSDFDKTYKRRALNYIRKHQEEKYKQSMREGNESLSGVTTGGKTYADNFNNEFDDSFAFLQKLTEQNSQKLKLRNSTLKHQPPYKPNSTLFENAVLDQILDQNISVGEKTENQNIVNMVQSPSVFQPSIALPKPTYGCLKGGSLPTFRTLKSRHLESMNTDPIPVSTHLTEPQPVSSSMTNPNPTFVRDQNVGGSKNLRMTPEQQRAELKQFLEHRKEEKQRVERVKRQRGILKPNKKQKRTTTRTFRVGKSKHYPRIGVLIPNKTIRTNVLAKKQKIRETPLEDVRRYLIKKGLIRVGSSCPNDVLRQMYESSMMMCGEIQNHNPDNLLYNYLHNGL
jgi:hypothetical protein